MNRSLLNTWASKEKELKARLETLQAFRDEGITDTFFESGTRLLIEELITMRGAVEKDLETTELEDAAEEISKGGHHEAA